MREVTIGAGECNRRFDKYLLKYFNDAPKSFIYKMLRKKRIKLNGCRAEGGEILKAGDVASFYLSDETCAAFMKAAPIPSQSKGLGIIFEDEEILIAIKPAGLLIHSTKPGDSEDTLTRRMLHYLNRSGSVDFSAESTFTPAFCNRLDRNTSGIAACGKTLQAVQSLSAMFAKGAARKIYIAAVLGEIGRDGFLGGYILKDKLKNESVILSSPVPGAKDVATSFTPIGRGRSATLLSMRLITGKSHQIRAHMLSIGHPVLGDPKYGDAKANFRLKREYGIRCQLLHAQSLVFLEDGGALGKYCGKEWTAPLPEMFQRFIDSEIELFTMEH
ncbi:MAG: RluA family pseudouridine synthase [Clostridiales bacterium]|jgi:23S rRNA pseudouridine955/2504/2580 synthase|nr:RluA family pseudouridine synthase [Clostridiales bacterium]